MRVVFFDDCEAEKRGASVSGSCVSPDGSWSSSGGGEPDDGVVGEGEPGSGGEFMVVVGQEMTMLRINPEAPSTPFICAARSLS